MERRPFDASGLGSEQFLIGVQAHPGELVRPRRLGERHTGPDHVPDRRRVRRDLGEPGRQQGVDDDG